MPVGEVDLAGLEATIAADHEVLVDFWGPMCGSCRRLRPHLERLSDEYDGQVRFVAVNAERETSAAGRFGVTAVPTVVLFRDGVEVTRLAGAVLPSQVAAVLQPDPD